MTFPTEQDRLFFASEEAKRIQELWEPKPGDWIYATDEVVIKSCVHLKPEGRIWFVVAARPESVNVYARTKSYPPPVKKRDAIFLPRQGQLQEMLEERGCDNWELEKDGPNYEFTYPGLHEHLVAQGPTPAIALGRALIEALSASEGKEE